jgi:hypothetical protein
VSPTASVHEASFKVQADAFPRGDWAQYAKVFKAKQASRGTWKRLDGPGFTIWISDVVLFDSRTVPPTWEIRVKSLSALNRVGEQCWQEVCQGIDLFFHKSGLERVESRAEL